MSAVKNCLTHLHQNWTVVVDRRDGEETDVTSMPRGGQQRDQAAAACILGGLLFGDRPKGDGPVGRTWIGMLPRERRMKKRVDIQPSRAASPWGAQ